MKSLLHYLVVLAVAMLSFSQAYAFESPSGYQAVYTVDWSYDSALTASNAGMPKSLSATAENNLTLIPSLNLPYISYTSGAYITYKYASSVVNVTVKPQRGYTKVLFS